MTQSNPDGDRLKKSVRLGMVVLAVRTALQQLVILLANVFIARWLEPADFGVFGILQFALSFLRTLSDAGLGAALVQQREHPNDTDLSTIWWFQLILGVALTAASFAVAPWLPRLWPSLPASSAWLLPGLALGLLFTMLQSVPVLLLERDVRFEWVGTIEFLGTVVFYGSALVLARMHAGAGALVAASVGQAAVVSIATNLVHPWKPRLAFDRSVLQRLLRFGAAFQGGNAIGFVNGAVTPTVVGARIGSDALGIIQFAESTAFFPSVLVGIVRRVYFPFLCRIQGDLELFRREFEESVSLAALPSLFFFGLLTAAGPLAIPLIYGDQWRVAVPSITLYSLGFCFTFFSWVGDSAMAALDDMVALFKIKVITAVLNWALTLTAIAFDPTPLAFARAYLVHLVLTPVLIYVAIRRRVPSLRIFPRIAPLLPATLAVMALGRLVGTRAGTPLGFVSFVLASLLLFSGAVLAADSGLRRKAAQALRTLQNRIAGTTR